MNATTQLKNEITNAVAKEVARPEVAAAATATSPIAAAVIREVVPTVQHLTNNEPWYQSRVTWGALISTAVPLIGMLGVETDWLDKDTAVSVMVFAGSAVGGALTLYGRWRARKPIGA